MRALVTGVQGFVGPHVVRALAGDGFAVTTFDLGPDRLGDFAHISGDLRDRDAVLAACQGQDVIVHVGAIGDVYLAGEQPDLAAEVNAVGCANVALAAQKAGARVVYASTWEVYGEPRYQPIDEDHPCSPDHPYNITKLAGEQLLFAADRLRDVPVVSLRLGTTYGPGLRPNSVFRIFIDRARKGEPITIQGDGSQGRQFTHVADIAEAFVLASRSDIRRTALNIVDDRTVSIKELAELVVARFPTELTFGAPRPGDVPPARVSNSRAAELLGWKPTTEFEAGLDALIASPE